MNGADATAAALELDGVGFDYPGRRVLEDVSFSVPAGVFCVLLGANGAGKTTLFSLITRLFLCRSGQIRILGRDVRHEAQRSLSQLGVVFQQPTLDLDLTVRQNLRYYCALQGLPTAICGSRATTPWALWGCSSVPTTRRASSAADSAGAWSCWRAMLHRPACCWRTSHRGLDIHSRQAIVQQVRDSCSQDGGRRALATHLVDEVRLEDQVVVIHRGRVLAQGRAAKILADTGSATVHDAFTALTGGPDG